MRRRRNEALQHTEVLSRAIVHWLRLLIFADINRHALQLYSNIEPGLAQHRFYYYVASKLALIDDKENYEYLTTMPESTEQTNSIMLDLILTKYSKEYRKFKKSIEKSRKKVWTHETNILNNCKEKSDFDNSMLDYNHLVNKYEYENYLQSLRSINQ